MQPIPKSWSICMLWMNCGNLWIKINTARHVCPNKHKCGELKLDNIILPGIVLLCHVICSVIFKAKKWNKTNKAFLPVSCEKHRKKRLYIVQVITFADVAVWQNLLNHQKQSMVKKIQNKQTNNNKNRATPPSNVIPLFLKTKVYWSILNTHTIFKFILMNR